MPKFQETDMQEVERGMAEISGSPFWKPPAGAPGKYKTSRIRILPPRADASKPKYFYWVAVHNIPGAGRAVPCPAKMEDQPCAACQKASLLWSRAEAAKEPKNGPIRNEARKFFLSWKALVNIVVLNNDGSVPDDAQIIPWQMSKTLMEALKAKVDAREDPKERNITHSVHGYDIKLQRIGTGLEDTKYEINPADVSTPLAPEVLALIEQDGLVDLSSLYPPFGSVRIEALLDAPRKLRELPAPDAFEEEDDDEEEASTDAKFRIIEDEEEDEEPTPRRGRAAAPSSADSRVAAARARLNAAFEEEDDDDE